MKKYLLKTFLLIVTLLVGVGETWAADEDLTINSTTINGTNVTVTCAKGSGTTVPAIQDNNYVRLYASNTVTISSTKNIVALKIGWSKNTKKDYASATANFGTYIDPESSGSTVVYGNWSGSSKSIVFTIGTGQKQIHSVEVTYEPTGGSNVAPTFTTQPVGATYTQNATATALTVVASGTPTPTYQWYSNTANNNTSGSAISGATTASYTPSTATVGTTYYYCVATNSQGSAKSNVAAIVVNASTPGGGSSSELTSGYFVKITGQSDIVDGGRYLIVREGDTQQYAAGIQPDATKNYLTVNEISTSGYFNGDVNASGKPYVYTLVADASNSGYFFMKNDGNFLTAASSGTDLTLESKASIAGYSDWDIVINTNGNALIKNKKAASNNNPREVRYNTGSPARFASYASTTGSAVTLYKWVPSVTISAAGYATFYDKDNAVTLPDGVEAYVAYMNGETFTFEKAYNAGDVLPANTPVVLKGSGFNVLTQTTCGNAPAHNDLIGTETAITAAEMEADNPGMGRFYALSLNAENVLSSIGFYWMNETGAAFALGAGKCYFALPASQQAKSFSFNSDDVTTSIKSVDSSRSINAVYNLAGQRVAANAKGLVIVNGKKIFNK